MDPSLALAAPQASLMTTIAQGIFSSQLEWQYIFMGIGLGICLVIINVFLTSNTKYALPPLAVGMGIYLPPSVQTPLVIGAIMGYFIDKTLTSRNLNEQSIDNHKRRGTLFASGLIVGESLMGVLLAGIIVVSVTNGGNETPLKIVSDEFLAGSMPEILGFIAFAAIIGYFYKLVVAGSENNAG